MGGCSSPKTRIFKLSEGITDVSLLWFGALLASLSKHLPAAWAVNAQPCSLEMPLGALPATASA